MVQLIINKITKVYLNQNSDLVFKRKKLKLHMSTFLTVLVRVVCDSYSIDFFI